MRREHLSLLACPRCRGSLALAPGAREDRGAVVEGQIACAGCGIRFPVTRGVPRFVPARNYAASFGTEWTRHARTQYDSASGTTISRDRLLDETRWPRNLAGEAVLEVGSGSGRFTEPLAESGATVVSVDYSRAVDANFASNGARPNVLVAQADVYALPVRRESFDRVLCIGVLQHTPRVARAFACLPPLLRPGGSLVVDVYRLWEAWRYLLMPRYWVRPLASRLPPEWLYLVVRRWVSALWPLTGRLARLSPAARSLSWALLVADYRGVLPLPEESLREWAILDTFDMLSPVYEKAQTLRAVRRWFREGGLEDVEVSFGHNGIVGRGKKPAL